MTLEIAKVYVRHNTAIVSMTVAIMFGAYLGQIPSEIWAAFLLAVSGCVYLDKRAQV